MTLKLPHENIVVLKKNTDIPNTYDIELHNITSLTQYDSLECHIVVYPYSRRVHGHHITFSPFEEYVSDILSCQRSAYAEITSEFNKAVGVFLGGLIFLIFYLFRPENLFSLESVVSVLTAYIIGKELWDDFEKMLVNCTKTWKIRYKESYYQYHLEKHTTLTNYSYLAKKRRYKKSPLLPEKIDFIQQSNSQTVRMWFNVIDFAAGPRHVLSITIDKNILDKLETDGFLFGVKLSFNKGYPRLVKSFEVFQSLDKGKKGCLNKEGKWVDNGVFYRKTYGLGKVKYYKKAGIIQGSIIDTEV
ncbi:MAG: hypothetical protein PVF58_20425 [Candidatus Methanofastidiosia archaeon]|jgi:hypothetical protein